MLLFVCDLTLQFLQFLHFLLVLLCKYHEVLLQIPALLIFLVQASSKVILVFCESVLLGVHTIETLSRCFDNWAGRRLWLMGFVR